MDDVLDRFPVRNVAQITCRAFRDRYSLLRCVTIGTCPSFEFISFLRWVVQCEVRCLDVVIAWVLRICGATVIVIADLVLDRFCRHGLYDILLRHWELVWVVGGIISSFPSGDLIAVVCFCGYGYFLARCIVTVTGCTCHMVAFYDLDIAGVALPLGIYCQVSFILIFFVFPVFAIYTGPICMIHFFSTRCLIIPPIQYVSFS